MPIKPKNNKTHKPRSLILGLAGVFVEPFATHDSEWQTLLAQPAGQSSFALEATALDKFKFEPRGIVFEFDAAKTQMTFKQGARNVVFTKED